MFPRPLAGTRSRLPREVRGTGSATPSSESLAPVRDPGWLAAGPGGGRGEEGT